MLNGVLPAQHASAGGVHRLFVYGTLRSAGSNHERLGTARQLKGYTRAQGYVMVDLGGYPGAVKVDNAGWYVYGEVYDISDQAFKDVENLEGYPNFYGRDELDLEHFGKCWIYTLPSKYLVKGCKIIPSGSWDAHKRNSYFWDPSCMEKPTNIPLISVQNNDSLRRFPVPVVGVEKKGEVVPEKPSSQQIQVGPGWEEA